MSGYLGDLSPDQEKALEQFKDKMKDYLTKPEHNDRYCLRWLRARSFNVNKATEMLTKHFAWRKEFGIDTILDDYKPHAVLDAYLPKGTLYGPDKDGRPVELQKIGAIDTRGMLQCATAAEVLRSHTYSLEVLQREINNAQATDGVTVIESATVITDAHGLSSRHLWRPGLKLFVDMMAIQQDNYPETLERVIIIRAPSIFPFLFNMVKGVFDARTRAKFDVVSGDWQKRLKEFIPESSLPPEYGGTAPGWGNATQAGLVPKSLYKKSDESYQKHSIGAGKAHLVEFVVERPNSMIAWDFFTEEFDIGFSLLYTDKDEAVKAKEMEEVHKYERYPNTKSNIEGTFVTTRIGRYLLRFDNTYSMMRSKTIMYKVECVLPDEKVIEDNV